MFKSSVTIASVAGIPIRIHISFLFILPFFVMVIANNVAAIAGMAGVAVESLTLSPYWLGFALAVLLFASIALHELAHSFVARGQGIEIRDITLMLLGGVAQMEDDGHDPRGEAWMALAGPLFSLVLGASLLLLVRFTSDLLSADLHIVLYYLGFMNTFLAVFNLLPAFPSDGGRILRSLLARRISYLRATQIATSIGRGFAFLFAVFGLMTGQLFMILIGLFIYIGASQEYQFNLLQETFSGFTVSDLMTSNVSTVREEMTAQQLLDRMFEEKHSGFPVLDEDGDLVGCVTMEDVRSATLEGRQDRIGDIMSRQIISVRPDDDLFSAFKKLSAANIGRLLVVDGEELAGIITRSDIMKAYRLKSIQEERGRREAPRNRLPTVRGTGG
ncbi:MAG: CBS domain-containing protein [Bacillota bacterium]